MILTPMRLIRSLIYSGTHKVSSLSQLRRIKLTNQICLLLSIASAPYIIIFYLLNLYLLSTLVVMVILSFLACILLNKYHFFNLSKFSIITSTSLAIIFYASSIGKEAGIQLLYIVLSVTPIVLFEFHEKNKILLAGGIPIIGWLLVELSHYSLGFHVEIHALYLKSIYAISCFLIMSINIMIIKFYFISNEKAEKRLSQALDQLQASNKNLNIAYTSLQESQEASKSLAKHAAFATLTRGIAHEIRNPLQMLQGRANLVLKKLDDKEKVKKFAEVIIRNTTRLSSLLKTMLEYGASAGEDKTSFSINTVLKDIQELSHSKCFQKKLNLTLDLSPNLTIFGNKIFIYQALLNLVVNAIQYTPNKGKIILKTEPCHYLNIHGNTIEGVKISVIDTGPGIPKDKQKEIFHPYHTTKNLPENTGLGLSIAQKTFMENNGLLDLYSIPGAGTTFMAYLPVNNTY